MLNTIKSTREMCFIKFRKVFVQLLIALSVLVGFLYWLKIYPQTGAFLTGISKRKISSHLKVLEPAFFSNQSDFQCVDANVGDLSFPMCLYDPKDDTIISKLVLGKKYYEANLVMKFVTFLRQYKDVSFVDLGANLGTYSLPIAHAGSQVIAVEPNIETVRRLAKAVHLGGISHRIDIFHYAIADHESTTFMKYDAKNRGDTFLVGNTSCPNCVTASVTILNNLAPFAENKRVIMKVDTQEAEIKIFTRANGGNFFDTVDVLMIQMEWVLYPMRFGKSEAGRRRVDRFLEFFYQRGYEVYDPRNEKKLNYDWMHWPFDVFFKKDSLPRDKLFSL